MIRAGQGRQLSKEEREEYKKRPKRGPMVEQLEQCSHWVSGVGWMPRADRAGQLPAAVRCSERQGGRCKALEAYWKALRRS